MLFAAVALMLSPVNASPAPPRPCAAPLHRQFDFWIGIWDVTGPAGKFAGINRIEAVDGGCALAESWSSAGGGYTGHSLNSVGRATAAGARPGSTRAGCGSSSWAASSPGRWCSRATLRRVPPARLP